jgi:hypothetical protein
MVLVFRPSWICSSQLLSKFWRLLQTCICPHNSIVSKYIVKDNVLVWCQESKLSTFSYVLNLKIDVVPKASHAIVIRRFSLNEAPLGLFKFISDYLPYFEKINIFFNIVTKKKATLFCICIACLLLYQQVQSSCCSHSLYS